MAAFEHLSLALGDAVDPSLADTFQELALEPVLRPDAREPATRWHMPGGGISVEFLAPRMQPNRSSVPLKSLGVNAQVLSYLNFLIAEPIPAVAFYREGVLVQIPRPERYAVHKLIVAAEWDATSAAKAKKDRAQAEWLFTILNENRPGELAAAWFDAMERGPKWRGHLERAATEFKVIGEIAADF